MDEKIEQVIKDIKREQERDIFLVLEDAVKNRDRVKDTFDKELDAVLSNYQNN